MKALIRACSKRAATGVRNRALIVVLYRAGLRISEALALYPKDLDAQASTIRVLHGKGDHDRVVGLDAGAWAIVQLWLDRRAAAGINGRAPVFCTLKGRPMKSAYVRTLLPRLARKAGIDKRVPRPRPEAHPRLRIGDRGHADPCHSSPVGPFLRGNHRPLHQAPEPGRRGRGDEVAGLDAVEAPGRPAGHFGTAIKLLRPRRHGPIDGQYTGSLQPFTCGFAGGHGRVNVPLEIETELVKLWASALAVERLAWATAWPNAMPVAGMVGGAGGGLLLHDQHGRQKWHCRRALCSGFIGKPDATTR